jgi:hypothetical protein
MASSKPIFKMLYLTLDANFGTKQLNVVLNVVLYNNTTFKTMPHTIKECGNKIVIKVETEMSPREFADFATKRINKINNKILFGLWADKRSAGILFHNLADLTDQQSWNSRSWVFDTETDIFVSNCEDDSLTKHDLNKEDLLIFK